MHLSFLKSVSQSPSLLFIFFREALNYLTLVSAWWEMRSEVCQREAVLYLSSVLWGERWQHVEHSSIIYGAPVIYIRTLSARNRRPLQYRTFNPWLLVSISYLPKPSVAVTVSNIWSDTSSRSMNRWGNSICLHPSAVYGLPPPPPGEFAALTSTVRVSPLQLCLMNSALITPAAILGMV